MPTAVSLDSESHFQRQLEQAAASADGDAVTLAREFAATDFVASASDAVHGDALVELVRRLREGEIPGVDQLRNQVREAVGGEDPEAFAAEAARARDTVVAAYLLPDAPSTADAKDLVRGYALATAVLSGDVQGGQVEAALDRPLVLPDVVAQLRSVLEPVSQPSPDEVARKLADEINELAREHRELTDALDDLRLHAEDELIVRDGHDQFPLGSLMQSRREGESAPSIRLLEGGRSAEKLAAMLPAETPRASPSLRAAVMRNVLLSEQALQLLPESTKEALQRVGVDPAIATVAEMHVTLSGLQQQAGQQLMELSGNLADVTYEFVGVQLKPHVHPDWVLDPVDVPVAPVDVPVTPPALLLTPPGTHTDIKPLGVADLMLVRTHISHYERSEVAAIENVLAHERLTHNIRTLDSTEITTTDDRESTDVRALAQSVADQENGHSTVHAVGPGLGPLAADGANSFAKNVTDQVSSNSMSRARRMTVERQLREREDRVEHLLDNAAGTTGEWGVYHWLDKVYTAQAFSYGSRLLYDLVVPEPSALLREALTRSRSGLPMPPCPVRFSLPAAKLTRLNWAYYATGHRATGVEPPPAEEVVVTEPFGGRASDPFSTDAVQNTFVTSIARSTRLPKGYSASRCRIVIEASGYEQGFLQVVVGSKHFSLLPAAGAKVFTSALDNEVESIPVAINATSDGVNWGILGIVVGVEIICTPTDELFSAWQARTHAQIIEANQRRFDSYEEAVANRFAAARAYMQSLSREMKQSIVRTEMQRVALQYLTGQSFAGFGAVAIDGAGFPYPSVPATTALAPYIRFFEQAIEWDKLAYAFYPYFWGGQASWVSKLLNGERDPQFAAFASSGAARVVLPVRPGYEAAFERFVNTGITPTNDELLDVGGKLWVSLVDQLHSKGAADGTETAVDEPWDFRLATDLVRLRPDGSMPKWSLSNDAWVESADPSF